MNIQSGKNAKQIHSFVSFDYKSIQKIQYNNNVSYNVGLDINFLFDFKIDSIVIHFNYKQIIIHIEFIHF